MLPDQPPSDIVQPGLSHLTLDLTPVSIDLGDTLAALQDRSRGEFGREMQVMIPLHQQMLGPLVVEAVVVRAPDRVQLRMMRRLGQLDQDLKPDWTLSHQAKQSKTSS